MAKKSVSTTAADICTTVDAKRRRQIRIQEQRIAIDDARQSVEALFAELDSLLSITRRAGMVGTKEHSLLRQARSLKCRIIALDDEYYKHQEP